MRVAVKILIVVVALWLVVGLGICAVQSLGAAGARMKCANNLKQIGIAIQNYHDACDHYPPAVVPDSDLPPE